MFSLNILLIFILIIKINSNPLCVESLNHCFHCNPITNLCSKCSNPDIYIPDKNGGCIGAKKCYTNKNFCIECDENGELCEKCEKNYYPDDNGGCSYSGGCKISYKGECLQCEENYILIGEEDNIKMCKYLSIEIYKNCKNINMTNGICEECKEGYYLSSENKCTNVEGCKESIFGSCISCNNSYYYNKKEEKCIQKEGNNDFYFCKQTINGINCDICEDDYYHDSNGLCVPTQYCLESENLRCKECISGYYLSNNYYCSKSDNCLYVDIFSFICTICKKGYYLDTKDFTCKSNLENNEYKYCLKVSDNECLQCENGYYLGEDQRCSFTKNCLESENGICLICSDNYYLDLYNQCINIENCIYSRIGECLECKDNYYYYNLNKTCVEWDENFKNCKTTCSYDDECCECKNNYYINFTDYLCYDNTKEGPFYKCSFTDDLGEICDYCEDGYFIGSEDKKCSKIDNCKKSENENKCLECDEHYCLDLKKQMCISNNYLVDENNKIYLNCNITNKEGTKCEQCLDGYEVGKEGYCIDINICEEKNEEDICLKCKDIINDNGNNYCANKIFGCLEIRFYDCLRCDNLKNLKECTECKEGYTKTNYGCIKKDI